MVEAAEGNVPIHVKCLRLELSENKATAIKSMDNCITHLFFDYCVEA